MITYRKIDYSKHSDKAEIVRMYRDIFQVDFAEEYDFLFGTREDCDPLGIVAIDPERERVVGHFTTIAFTALIDEKPSRFRMSMGFMTDPEYRGQGIATNLYFELKKAILAAGDGTCFIIGFPNENSVHMHVARMEYQEFRRFHFVRLPNDAGADAAEFTRIDAVTLADLDARNEGSNRVQHTSAFLNFRFADEKYEKYISDSGNVYICTRFRDKFDILYWSDCRNEKELLAFARFLYGREGVARVTTWNSLDYLDKYPAEEREYHMCINYLNNTEEQQAEIDKPWSFLMGDCELF